MGCGPKRANCLISWEGSLEITGKKCSGEREKGSQEDEISPWRTGGCLKNVVDGAPVWDCDGGSIGNVNKSQRGVNIQEAYKAVCVGLYGRNEACPVMISLL